MSGVNLLPEAFRATERTPPAVFAAVLAGVVLATSSVMFAVILRFGTLARVRAERSALEEERATLKGQEAYHQALVGGTPGDSLTQKVHQKLNALGKADST